MKGQIRKDFEGLLEGNKLFYKRSEFFFSQKEKWRKDPNQGHL